MHQYDSRQVTNFYRQAPEHVAAILQIAAADFSFFFQSREQYENIKPFLIGPLTVYSRLCYLTGDYKAKAIVLAALDYLWQAYSRDKKMTLSILASAATDGDAALSTYWSLLKRYGQQPWKDESLLLRDRVSEMLTFASEYIEGVIKRELWALLAYRDIANRRSKDPSRWQKEKLGNMISSAASFPDPLGSFLGTNPLPGVTLNHFRNIGAHKDFVVKRGKIILFPASHTIEVSLSDLEEALNQVGAIRMFLKVFHDVALLQDVEGLSKAGYQPFETPEAVAMYLVASLGPRGVYVERVQRIDTDTQVFCSTDRDYTDQELLLIVLQHTIAFLSVYSDTFGTSPDSKIQASITDKEGVVLSASTSIKEVRSALSKPGNTEIIFDVCKNGVTTTGRLKAFISDDAPPLDWLD